MIYNGISVIVLAAGFSSRMGRLKALLPWQGIPLIQYQIEQMQKAEINEIIVVLGYQAKRIYEVIEHYNVKTVFNEHYEQGKSSSIRKGAASVNDDAEAIFVSAVDQPVSSSTLKDMTNCLKLTETRGVIPVYKGKRGHPVLFHGSLKKDLSDVKEKTMGLRNILGKNDGQITYLTVDDPSILLNFNKPDDYNNRMQGGL
ncbi:hypothetical protein CIL03_14025 [Virgibacillus indicus]|uniref:MobA-like NTP transferase domain-containing protein n=1 Tax=Virgibacillus indicus TaxID=2024554 RepID=A0A265N724_9BACI|nr:nucleotidyltransferase family protein [Virgibacillus indicus]OZU87820.1 hypothetical protein CIL03_14025 [Virgibacillus indicus]